MDVGIRAVTSGFEEASRHVAGLNSELGKTAEAGKKVDTAAASGAQSLTELASVARIAGAAVGGTLVVAFGAMARSIAEGFTETLKLGDELVNLKQRTGQSVEELGSLRLAAMTSGVSLNELAIGMQQFSRHIDDATKGTGQSADAFRRLGIELRDSEGQLKTNDELLLEVAGRFRSLADGAGKTTLAMELFGSSGAALIPLLNEGADGLERLREEARKAGIVLSEETASAAKELNENLIVLKANLEGWKIELAGPFVRVLADVTTEMRAAKNEGFGWVSALDAIVKKLPDTVLAFVPFLAALRVGHELAAELGIIQTQGTLAPGGALISEPPGSEQVAEAIVGPSRASQRIMDQQEEFERRQRQQEARRLDREGEAEFRKLAKDYKELEDLRLKSAVEFWANFEREGQQMVTTWDAAGNRIRVTKEEFRLLNIEAEQFKQILGDAGGFGMAAFRSLAATVTQVFSEILRGHVNLTEQISRIWRSVWLSMINEVARNMARTVLEPIFKPFKELFDDLGKYIRDTIFKPVWEFIKSGFLALWEWMKSINWGSAFNTSGIVNSLFGGGGGGGGGGIVGNILGSVFGAATKEEGSGVILNAAGASGSSELTMTYAGLGGESVAGASAASAGAGEGAAVGAGAGAGEGAAAAGLASYGWLGPLAVAAYGFYRRDQGRKELRAQEDYVASVLGSRGALEELQTAMAAYRNSAGVSSIEAAKRATILGEDPSNPYITYMSILGQPPRWPAGTPWRDQEIITGDQTGGSHVFSKPQMLMVAETGAERVTVEPLAGGFRGTRGAGSTFNFYGPVMMDEYTMRQFKRMVEA